MFVSEPGEELEVTAAEAAAARRQLERVLAHTAFRNSRRCQAFLRFVMNEKLNGNAAHLKERMIGVAVFQQPLDYDTNANSAVRVTAGDVRRRLAQYYIEANSADEMVIDLPLGSYIPDFRVTGNTALLPAPIASPVDRMPLSPEASAVASLPAIVAVAVPPRWFSQQFLAIGMLLLCGIVAAAVLLASSKGVFAGSESDRIWSGAIDGGHALLCAGSLDSRVGDPVNSLPANPKHVGFSFTTASTAAVIGTAIGHSGGQASMLPAQDTKIEDLQHAPAVLIGAFTNEWTMRLQTPLPYQFVVGSHGVQDAIVDVKNRPGKRYEGNTPYRRDYGIFAHFTSPVTGQSTTIVAGLGAHGTAAVRIFLASPQLQKEFAKSAPARWEKGNYEIVFGSDEVNGLADPPKVLETYFW